jgi:hypothetical protein
MYAAAGLNADGVVGVALDVLGLNRPAAGGLRA